MRFLCGNLKAKKIIFELKLRPLLARVRYMKDPFSFILYDSLSEFLHIRTVDYLNKDEIILGYLRVPFLVM